MCGIDELRTNIRFPSIRELTMGVFVVLGMMIVMTLFVSTVDSTMLYVISTILKRPLRL